MSRYRRTRRLAIGAVGLATAIACPLARAQSGTPGPLKDLLDQTGLVWSPVEQSVDSWRVPYESSDGRGPVEVFLTYNDDSRQFALLFATVVDRPEYFDFGKDVLVECMRLNNDYSGVKFCLDARYGDIDCQTELLMSALDAETLALSLERVADLADQHRARLDGMVP
ncbi:MAG TPA: hypothetical protein PLL30_15145 [Candidatus Krumholzibacteria bacterium]|nr:hypothetical protein [Candidatus Krumholzibacteria bacterium]HPD73106.1 hypothetical protein [Candidatus Krumholzibacteria bacterium]HRY41906.1 hypothetical protein [Candidatus Krumholzibacteria bacterium]